MSCHEEHAIHTLLQRYFDALYYCDTEKLSKALHKQAIYACIENNTLLTRNMTEYFELVRQRTSPHQRGEVRRDHILSIDFAGPETALAKVNCSIGERFFTDYLSLLKYDGRWWIMAKVFHYDLI